MEQDKNKDKPGKPLLSKTKSKEKLHSARGVSTVESEEGTKVVYENVDDKATSKPNDTCGCVLEEVPTRKMVCCPNDQEEIHVPKRKVGDKAKKVLRVVTACREHKQKSDRKVLVSPPLNLVSGRDAAETKKSSGTSKASASKSNTDTVDTMSTEPDSNMDTLLDRERTELPPIPKKSQTKEPPPFAKKSAIVQTEPVIGADARPVRRIHRVDLTELLDVNDVIMPIWQWILCTFFALVFTLKIMLH